MHKLKILNSKETKEIYKLLKDNFGFEDKLDFAFLMNKDGKIYVVNKEIKKIDFSNLRVDAIGMYFAEIKDGELRLSIEGSQLIGPKATKNVVELSKEEMIKWLKGFGFEKNIKNGFYIMKHGNDFMGTGKCSQGKIYNYVPKARRISSID